MKIIKQLGYSKSNLYMKYSVNTLFFMEGYKVYSTLYIPLTNYKLISKVNEAIDLSIDFNIPVVFKGDINGYKKIINISIFPVKGVEDK